METEEIKNSKDLILSDGAIKFIEWREKEDDGWYFDTDENIWTKYNHNSRTTQQLFELWKKESGYEG